jgi:hypothetical protein
MTLRPVAKANVGHHSPNGRIQAIRRAAAAAAKTALQRWAAGKVRHAPRPARALSTGHTIHSLLNNCRLSAFEHL